MREINLAQYEVQARAVPQDGKGTTLDKTFKYDVRGSLIEILFAPELGLKALEVLARDDLARKIRDWPDETLLLEDAEYEKVKSAIENVTGLGRDEIELIRRVLNASKVEVKKADPAPEPTPASQTK